MSIILNIVFSNVGTHSKFKMCFAEEEQLKNTEESLAIFVGRHWLSKLQGAMMCFYFLLVYL